ncbi:MAG: hypothetical protein Q7R33_02345 [Nitrosarchaeum sp.]|nr:hypothetical protein [Nitrosarchaeum sp.]
MFKKFNRIQKTKPLSDKSSWCPGCDREKIREGEKCPSCGYKEKTKHMKLNRGANDS